MLLRSALCLLLALVAQPASASLAVALITTDRVVVASDSRVWDRVCDCRFADTAKKVDIRGQFALLMTGYPRVMDAWTAAPAREGESAQEAGRRLLDAIQPDVKPQAFTLAIAHFGTPVDVYLARATVQPDGRVDIKQETSPDRLPISFVLGWDDGDGPGKTTATNWLHAGLHGKRTLAHMVDMAENLLTVASRQSRKVGGPSHIAVVDESGSRWLTDDMSDLHFDGTNVTINQGAVTINENGISIIPSSSASDLRAYRWDNLSGTGDFGLYGWSTVAGGTSSKAISLSVDDDSGLGTRQATALLSAKVGAASQQQSSVTASVLPGFGERVQLSVINAGGTSYGLTLQPALLTATTGVAVRFANYGAGTATFDASGNITSTSDERMKTDIESYPRGLADILNLRPVSYRWSDTSGLDTEHRYVGFLAQDVAKVLPDAVGVRPDGMMTLQDRTIIAALVNSVKELKAEVERLKRR